MEGFVGNLLNTGVYLTLTVVFIIIFLTAMAQTSAVLGAVGGTGLATLAVTYLTSKQKWVEK